MDAKSPTLALVKEISEQDHDMQACQLEVLATQASSGKHPQRPLQHPIAL
jgi:hypothetical protein